MTRFTALGLGVFIFYTLYVLREQKFRPQKNEAEKEIALEQEETSPAFEEDLHDEYFEPAQKFEKSTVQERDSITKDTIIKSNVEEPVLQQKESHSEFQDALLHTLEIMKEVTFGHTAAFFWVNTDAQQLIVEAKISDGTAFIAEKKIFFGDDLVSQLAVRGEAQIVNQITAESEKDLLRYYTNLQEVKSFVGAPVFYPPRKTNDAPIAVLVVDSKAEDAFGEETYTQLGHFSNLVSLLIKQHTEKFDLQFDAHALELIRNFQRHIGSGTATAGIINALLDSTEQLVQWETLSVVLFDEVQRKWILGAVHVRGTYKFVAAKQLVEFDESLVGNCLRTSATYVEQDLSRNSRSIFYSSEPDELLKRGSLLIVPFVAHGKAYGAIVVTAHHSDAFVKKEIAVIEHLASVTASAFETLELSAIIAEHVVVDEQTGVLTKKFFCTRMEEELSRANERDADLSLVLVAITNTNDVEQRYGTEGMFAALLGVTHMLRANVRTYDIVGRMDAGMLSVLFSETTAHDALIWAEKLRSAIAAHVITVGKKNFSVSVTIGIAGATNGMKPEELLKNALYITEQAKKAGGNMVRVF